LPFFLSIVILLTELLLYLYKQIKHNNMIRYLKGDATYPENPLDENIIIPHICNNIGAWGAGFVVALSKRWEQPEALYRALIHDLQLGDTQFVQVEDNIIVANMIAQNNIISNTSKDNPPIDYKALKTCLKTVNDLAKKTNSVLHMPKIGSGLAGGNWDVIEDIIKNTIEVDGYVYLFE
jgi:O-acetyl-ADP-ribose deacetylase (regulator of RNase III)